MNILFFLFYIPVTTSEQQTSIQVNSFYYSKSTKPLIQQSGKNKAPGSTLEAMNYHTYLKENVVIIRTIFMANIVLWLLIGLLIFFIPSLTFLWAILEMIFLCITALMIKRWILLLGNLAVCFGLFASLVLPFGGLILKIILHVLFIAILAFLLNSYRDVKFKIQILDEELGQNKKYNFCD